MKEYSKPAVSVYDLRTSERFATLCETGGKWLPENPEWVWVTPDGTVTDVNRCNMGMTEQYSPPTPSLLGQIVP